MNDKKFWLDETGAERVRVDWRDGQARVAAVEQLQNKAQRYYFVETMNLPKGSFYLSRFDLNQEYGELERPLQAGEITAVVVGVAARVVLAGALVVVGWVAIVEAVDHREVDDLVAPVRRRHVQRARRAGRGGGRPGDRVLLCRQR